MFLWLVSCHVCQFFDDVYSIITLIWYSYFGDTTFWSKILISAPMYVTPISDGLPNFLPYYDDPMASICFRITGLLWGGTSRFIQSKYCGPFSFSLLLFWAICWTNGWSSVTWNVYIKANAIKYHIENNSCNAAVYDEWPETCIQAMDKCWYLTSTVYPKKYAHGFVVLCFVVVMQSLIMNSHEVFIHIHQGCFAGTGAIVRLPQCQWSKPDRYGKISQCITTTKHSKAKTVCIFLGIYCSKPPAAKMAQKSPFKNYECVAYITFVSRLYTFYVIVCFKELTS